MDIRKYLGKKTQKENSDRSSGEVSETEESLCRAEKNKIFMTFPISNKVSAQQKKKYYKKKLSYKKVWEKKLSLGSVWRSKSWHVCTPCKIWGRPPPIAKGGWTTRGIVDWNHATELLKQHSGSKCHQDSSITAWMAKLVEQQNVIEMQCAGAAKQAEEQKKKNSDIIL